MNKFLKKKLELFKTEYRYKSKWRKVAAVLCAVVAFMTSYSLIKPATTQKAEAYCGIEEHVHTEDCYEEIKVLVCPYFDPDDEYVFNDVDSEEGFESFKVGSSSEETMFYASQMPDGQVVYLASPSDAAEQASPSDAAKASPSEAASAKPASPSEDRSAWETDVKIAWGADLPKASQSDCDEEDGMHHHTDACYRTVRVLVCDIPVHEHSLQCYSNPEADVEDASSWDKIFENIALTGNWNKDLISVARTQLGYAESEDNYEVEEDGVTMNGYTRYGEWYGDKYGDWCAMFAAFCMHYAGIDSDIMPVDASCQNWVEKLSDAGLYRDECCYTPVPGDIVFFSHGGNSADHVGIVEELVYDEDTKELTGIITIEGNSGDQVCENHYDIDCENIMGYGVLPQNPEWFSMTTITERGVQVNVEGLRSSLPYPVEEIALSARELTDEEREALKVSELEEDIADDMEVVPMDISLFHGEESIEPVGPVYLSFVAEEIVEDSAVYHIDEENETVTEMPAEVNEIEGAVSLETEHFSTFVLTLRAKSGKTVTAEVQATWDETSQSLTSVLLKAKSSSRLCFNYDLFDGSNWTIGAGTWSAQANANTEVTMDITDIVNSSTLATMIRARGAEQTANPTNDKSGYSEEFSLYDLLDAAKPGFTDWVSGPYIEFFGGTRPTTAAQLLSAFAIYFDLPSLTLSKEFIGAGLIVTAATDADFNHTFKWQYYDDATGQWKDITGENGSTLNATTYSKELNSNWQEGMANLDGGKNIRCLLYKVIEGGDPEIKAVASLNDVNPLQEEYDAAIIAINTGLNLKAYPWYLDGSLKTANVEIGGTCFMDYFYYDNVARDDDVPFYDGESYKNYLASEYRNKKNELIGKGKSEEEAAQGALEHAAAIWNQYIFDLYNPNPDAGVVGNYSYYPKANPNVDPEKISTYGDKIIEWPKDNGSSFHNERTGYVKEGLVKPLAYDFLEGGVDYSKFVQSLDKTATADAAGDNNTNRSYDIDITAKTQASSVSPLVMLVTIQTSWQLFDYAHANCVVGDGTYTKIEVGAAQYNTEMANLYDIKQAFLRFIDYMDENFPGNNLVLGINEVQHAGSSNLISYDLGKNNKDQNIVYVSNDSKLLRESLYDWDTFGNCEHVHYDTNAMVAAAQSLAKNLDDWKDKDGNPIQYEDVNKVAVIIGGGTENTNSNNGYGCALPWSTFAGASINSVYGIRTNVGTPLNTKGVLSWLDNEYNNTGEPYSLDTYSSGASTGNFTAKFIAPSEDEIFNTLVKIASREMASRGMKVYDESKYIDAVTVSDTVADEFRIENGKPFAAAVTNKNGNKLYETIITPASYDASGHITGATATFVVYNSDGTVKSTDTPDVTVAETEKGTELSVTLDIPYSYTDNQGITHEGTKEYTQKLIVCENGNKTTDVSYDFGTVYTTDDAKLHFEVIARDDYIGSNNVFSNDSTPEVSFEHIKLTREGEIYIDPETGKQVIVHDTVEGYDTPEVNVPIRFDVEDGGGITIEAKKPVNLEHLSTTPDGTDYTLPSSYTGEETDVIDSEYITANVHDLIDNYDQINGTVSYTWVIPGGKEYPVPVTLHVTNGVPDSSITAASEMAQQWTPKSAGSYDVVLRVTFTPDSVTDNGNFADDGGVTATRVTKLDKEGKELITVVGGDIPTTNETELTITKVWSGEKGITTHRPASIMLNVFQNGEFYGQKEVTSEDGWSWTVTGLPYADERNVPYEYSVSEDKVKDYETSYGELQVIDPTDYWKEVPLENLDLTGETEYLIVRKDVGQAVNPDNAEKVVSVDVNSRPDENEYITPPDGSGVPLSAESYFTNSNYSGWYIKYTDGTANVDNYVKSTPDGSSSATLYIKKDATFANAAGNDTCLKLSPTADGKIKLNGNYLAIEIDKGNYKIASTDKANKATAFSFYVKNEQNNWYEIPLKEVDLSGSTEYMIVDKETGIAINPNNTTKVVSVALKKKVAAFPADIADDEGIDSFIWDNGYEGWKIAYTENGDKTQNYIESASDDTTLYIKKDGNFDDKTGADTLLAEDPKTYGKIKLNDKYLKLKDDGTLGNDGSGTVFAFYEKVTNTAKPTYRTSVTNTYIPTGETPNETKVAVEKKWINTDTQTEITVNLLQNGKKIDSRTLNASTGWMYTFENLPGTTTKLPYFDELTGEPYDYTVTEDVVSGYETGYKKSRVEDPEGGQHFVLFTESSNPSSTELWPNTTYVLITPLTTGKGDKAVTKDYIIGNSGDGFTVTEPTIQEGEFHFGNLTCTKELTSEIPSSDMWTIEAIDGSAYFRVKINGQYLGVKKDGKALQLVSTPKDKDPCCNWGFVYDDVTGKGKLYGLQENDEAKKKYLSIKFNDKGKLEVGLGDANAGSPFTIFEKISLSSKYDTYAYEVQNISTSESSDGDVAYNKYIDFLGDGVENPDTSLSGDYYRLYLDAVGMRPEATDADPTPAYPAFKGVYITDHLSQYATIARYGQELGLTINKVKVSDPTDITYLWYGNLDMATGNIGSAVGDGADVIKSVVYTAAEEDQTDTTGMIRVDFQPEYLLEEGYKYIISYNIEATDLARSEASYPEGSIGDPDTDYTPENPVNHTSSNMPGYHSNSFADVVYTQDDEVEIGIYQHPVIQVAMGEELPMTGGAGTAIFCILGSILLAGAAVLLFTKKRMSTEK